MGCRSVHATQVERSHLQQKSRPTLETSESESSRWNTEANHVPWLPQFRWVGVTTHKKDQRVVILVTHQPTVLCFAHIWGTESDTDGQTKRPGTQQQWERDARDAEVLRKTPTWGPVTGPPCSKLLVSTSVQSDPLLHVLERPHRGNCPLWMSCCHVGLKLHQINHCACKKQEKHQGESSTLNSSRSSSIRNFVVLKVKRLLLNMEKDRWSQGAMQHDATMAQAFYTKKSQKSLWDLLCYRVFSLD